MNHEDIQQLLDFEEPILPLTSLPPIRLPFGILLEDLQPIEKISRLLNPDADQTNFADWGILFFVCGAMAGHVPFWKSAVLANLRDLGLEDYQEFLCGCPRLKIRPGSLANI